MVGPDVCYPGILSNASDVEVPCKVSGAECRPSPGELHGIMAVVYHAVMYL